MGFGNWGLKPDFNIDLLIYWIDKFACGGGGGTLFDDCFSYDCFWFDWDNDLAVFICFIISMYFFFEYNLRLFCP